MLSESKLKSCSLLFTCHSGKPELPFEGKKNKTKQKLFFFFLRSQGQEFLSHFSSQLENRGPSSLGSPFSGSSTSSRWLWPQSSTKDKGFLISSCCFPCRFTGNWTPVFGGKWCSPASWCGNVRSLILHGKDNRSLQEYGIWEKNPNWLAPPVVEILFQESTTSS